MRSFKPMPIVAAFALFMGCDAERLHDTAVSTWNDTATRGFGRAEDGKFSFRFTIADLVQAFRGASAAPRLGNAADTSEFDLGNPLAGLTLYVNPDSNAAREAESLAADGDPTGAALMRKIADHSVASWIGDWNSDVEATVRGAVDTAAASGSTPVFVAYNIPDRDCGNHSSGGASDANAYMSWIDGVARGLGGRKAVFVLEPDAVSLVDCLSAEDQQARFDMIAYAVQTLKAEGGIVYIDAGHSSWVDAATMASRLTAAGIADADGFALNVSNFQTTESSVAFGDQLGELLGGAHYVVDTSRNGLGPGTDWCNPGGRALGLPPGTDTASELADGYLWIKAPGESDGACNGGPSAGTWWPEYARGLAERATW